MAITQQFLKEHPGNSDIEWVHSLCTSTWIQHMFWARAAAEGEHRMFLHWQRLYQSLEDPTQSSLCCFLLLTQDCHCEAALTAFSWGRCPGYNPSGRHPLSSHSCSPLRPHMSLLLGDCLWLNLSPTFWILIFSSKKGFTVCDSRSTHGKPAFLTVCQGPVASNNARWPLEGQTGRWSPGD